MTRIPYAYSQRPPRIIRTAVVRPTLPVEVVEPAPSVEETQTVVVEETQAVEAAQVEESVAPVEESPAEESPVEESPAAESPLEETSALPEWNALMRKADLYDIAEKAGLSVNPEMTKAEIVDLLKTVQ